MNSINDFYDDSTELEKADDTVNVKSKLLSKIKNNKKLMQILLFGGVALVATVYLVTYYAAKNKENTDQAKLKYLAASPITTDVREASYEKTTTEEEMPQMITQINTDAIGNSATRSIGTGSQTVKGTQVSTGQVSASAQPNTTRQVVSSNAGQSITIDENYIRAVKSPQVISGTKSNVDQQRASYTGTNVGISGQMNGTMGANTGAQNQVPSMYGSPQQSSISDFTLLPGTIVQAVLINAINSDLPGLILARVTRTVYDTQNGNVVLIPQGTVFIADYSSDVSLQQDRLQVIWRRMVRPDGIVIDIQGFGTDKYGTAGVPAKVNRHILLKSLGIGMTFLYGVGAGIANAVASETTEAGKTVLDATTQPVLQTSNAMINQTLNVPNTLLVKAGTVATIILFDSLLLPAYK